MKAAPPPTSHLPPPVLLAVAALVPTVALLVLATLHIPLGKPGTLVYPYSGFDALRLGKLILAVPPIALLALAVYLAGKLTPLPSREGMGEGSNSARTPLPRPSGESGSFAPRFVSVLLLTAGLAGMGAWALTSAPKWSQQNFFNFASPSQDGAFLQEVGYVRRVGILDYLRNYPQRAAMPPAEMKGTRVISNPPGFTLLALLCDSLVSTQPALRVALERIAVDTPGEPAEFRFLAARALLFASLLIGMWFAGGLALYAAARVLLPPHVAMFVAICASLTPMTLLFMPGKDAAQVFTVAFPLWLWLKAAQRGSSWWALAAGAAACLACFFGLVHLWVAATVLVASAVVWIHSKNLRMLLWVVGFATAGALLTDAALWWLTGYDMLRASQAIAAAQAQVTRGANAMPFWWQALGAPLFDLFCGPALWFLALCGAYGTTRARNAGFGWALTLTTAGVMLGTIGFTNIETPRLWIPFAVLLTLGMTCGSAWTEVKSHAAARLLIWLVVLQGLVSAYQWSRMDMRETEMRLLEKPDGKARLFQ